MDLPTTRHDNPPAAGAKIHEHTGKSGILEKISFYLVLAVIFLTPLAFIPSPYIPLDVVKLVVVSFGILAAAILCSVEMLKTKKISLPKGPLAYASLAVILSVILSSVFSDNFLKSFFGQGFEIGTASFILLMFGVAILVMTLVERSKERIFSIYSAIFASFIILALFHIVRLLGGAEFLTLGVFTNLSSTPIGKWYDFAILSGLVGFLSLLGIKFLSLGKGMKWLLYIVLVLSGILLFIINFNLLWWGVAIVALSLAVFEYSAKAGQGNGIKKFFSRISWGTLIILVIAVVCAWKGNSIATPVANSLGISYAELVLPWQMTLDVTADTIKESPLLGSGPNRFGNEFLKYKPLAINPTQFSGYEFTSGFGTLPSFVVTQGILGLLVWALFFIFFIKLGIAAVRKQTDQFKKFAIISSFLGALFLWIMHLIYVPSHSIFFLAFVMTGIFGASLVKEGFMSYGEPKFLKKYPTVVSIIALIILVAWLGMYIKKTVAVAYFQAGIKELNSGGSVETAQAKFNKALFWKTSDVYYQALSETSIMKLGTLTQSIQAKAAETKTAPTPADIEQVTNAVKEALGYTQKAIALDPANYYNHIAQARVLEAAASLQIPDAYNGARISYANAITANPWNPALYLNLARFEASQGKYTEAQQNIGRALQLKQNYLEAIFFLSQVQVANNQIKDAIVSSQVATQLNPSEPLLFFQLGLLQYNDRNYSDAAQAFAKAVALNGEYANARYFLGLSYSRLGKNADAIAQFEELARTNPESEEVVLILSNLKSGKSPFTNAEPPIDTAPEKRKNLPVEEKKEKTTTSE